MTSPPDVLVLAGGGVLGEAWMEGLLAGYEDAAGHDFRGAKAFVGTSAGSIVSAALASGRRPRRPGSRSDLPPQEGDAAQGRDVGGLRRQAARAATLASAPLASAALVAGAPFGARVRALALARASGGLDQLGGLRGMVERWGARWDGRLRICAVDRGSGRRVVFGAAEAPSASVAEAVQASCSIPWVFRPVRIGGREYVDGGAWSITNLDVAPVERGDNVWCLNPTQGLDLGAADPVGLMRLWSGARTAVEAAAVRSRGVHVRFVAPAAGPAELMSRGLMDGRHAGAVRARAYAQGERLARG